MIPKPLNKLILLIPLTLGLSGCVLVPGSNIDSSAYSDEAAWFDTRDGIWFPGLRGDESDAISEDLAELLTVVAITPQLLVQQPMLTRATLPNAVPAARSAELQQELADYEYYVGRGDMLLITVYDHPELTNPSGSNNNAQNSGIIVENDGTIYYPYIGTVPVAGLTVDEIREAISVPLAEYITDPQVSVRVIGFNAKRAYITGQISSPGPQPITNVPLTVLDAIANAGGLGGNANWHEVLLSRNGEDTRLSVYEMLNNGRLGQNMLLQHGDVLHVPEIDQQEVFVLGELNRVNILPMGNFRMSLTEALTQSGGLNQVTSNAEGIFVIRQNPVGSERLATLYQLNVRNAISFAVGANFMLQPQDIIYVTTAPVTRWNRVISQILPSVTALFTLERLSDI